MSKASKESMGAANEILGYVTTHLPSDETGIARIIDKHFSKLVEDSKLLEEIKEDFLKYDHYEFSKGVGHRISGHIYSVELGRWIDPKDGKR